ncbi:MAG: DNA gyrase inhibitor YacG [Tepidisphaeraceae bacterium]
MRCPICNRPVEEPTPGERSPYPFCNDRCKLIDLGRWLGRKYQLDVKPEDDEDGHVPSNDEPGH